jgi:hypothetical protein
LEVIDVNTPDTAVTTRRITAPGTGTRSPSPDRQADDGASIPKHNAEHRHPVSVPERLVLGLVDAREIDGHARPVVGADLHRGPADPLDPTVKLQALLRGRGTLERAGEKESQE